MLLPCRCSHPTNPDVAVSIPASAELEIYKVKDVVRKFPNSPTDFTFTLKLNARLVDWDCDPGSEDAWLRWKEVLTETSDVTKTLQ